MTKKPLLQLFADFPLPFEIHGSPQGVQVTRVVFDSRLVQPGDLFVALPGVSSDGHRYIPAAIEKGAVAVLGNLDLSLRVPFIKVDNTRAAMAYLSAALEDWPARGLTVIGVTGTDGKTTTSSLIHRILLQAGLKAGMISTVNAVIGDEVLDTGFHVTTPDSPDLQRYLRRMVDARLTHVVLESTSHGLAQERATGCEFDIGVVTNITHEHLDYHGSYEEYRAAKGRLFTMLAETREKKQGNPRLAVLNRDDASYDYLHTLAKVRKVSYGLGGEADLTASGIRYKGGRMHFRVSLRGMGIDQEITTNLLGDYNVSNCLAAFAAVVEGLGIDPAVAAEGIAAMPGIPGRMERIDLGQDFTAIVDFAHTPNALKVALEQARKMTKGHVIAIFGSAGLRDREKRRLMAEVSVGLADITILTAEDPRTESLEGILAEMASAAAGKGGVEGKTFYRIPDRGEAIRLGVKLAKAGDLVIACGKGHEQSMCFGVTEYPWDDRTAMKASLAERLGVKGEKMPELPTS
jgi:UDP-N-acetylmuramoyl-L-alanyl-D-glutamate--2,6-diaminopimelate ligase